MMPVSEASLVLGLSMSEWQAVGIVGGLIFAGSSAAFGIFFNYLRTRAEIKQRNAIIRQQMRNKPRTD